MQWILDLFRDPPPPDTFRNYPPLNIHLIYSHMLNAAPRSKFYG